MTNEKDKKSPERIRYAVGNKNYACIAPKCKAHHDTEYIRVDLHEAALTTARKEARAETWREVLQIADNHLNTPGFGYLLRTKLLEAAAASNEKQTHTPTFKNTKEAMLYAQRNNIPLVIPVEVPTESSTVSDCEPESQ